MPTGFRTWFADALISLGEYLANVGGQLIALGSELLPPAPRSDEARMAGQERLLRAIQLQQRRNGHEPDA